MIMDFVDCVRVCLGFLVVFGVVPLIVSRLWRSKRNVVTLCAIGVRTTLFAQIAGLVLGSIGICLPGSMLACYGLLFLTLLWSLEFLQPLREPEWWSARLHKVILLIERTPSPRPLQIAGRNHPRHSTFDVVLRLIRQPAFLFSVLVTIAALSHSLRYARFLNDENYLRALSLQKLTLGQPWTPDGSVAFLAPVVFLSSLDGAAVIRFSGPLFMGLLAFAAFTVIRRLTGHSQAGLAAAAIVVALTALSQNGEMRAGAVALIFWLLGIALWQSHRWDAIWSGALALLIEPMPGWDILAGICAVFLVVLFVRFVRLTSRGYQAIGISLAGSALAVLLLLPLDRANAHGSQYNVTARTVGRIRREFPRNTWLVVSPVQEVALTYGHGWHMELSEFVERYKIEEVSHPDFSFRFPVRDTFVFVEKQPLTSVRMASDLSELGPRFDPPIVPYQLRLNRASLQFQAGRMMAAYRATHRDVQVFLDDPVLIVYRIRS